LTAGARPAPVGRADSMRPHGLLRDVRADGSRDGDAEHPGGCCRRRTEGRAYGTRSAPSSWSRSRCAGPRPAAALPQVRSAPRCSVTSRATAIPPATAPSEPRIGTTSIAQPWSAGHVSRPPQPTPARRSARRGSKRPAARRARAGPAQTRSGRRPPRRSSTHAHPGADGHLKAQVLIDDEDGHVGKVLGEGGRRRRWPRVSDLPHRPCHPHVALPLGSGRCSQQDALLPRPGRPVIPSWRWRWPGGCGAAGSQACESSSTQREAGDRSSLELVASDGHPGR
jgi:hypothetical protein